MYYRRALQLQDFLDHADSAAIESGYGSISEASKGRATAMADMKFSYVASCQDYGNQKRKRQKEAVDIFELMQK